VSVHTGWLSFGRARWAASWTSPSISLGVPCPSTGWNSGLGPGRAAGIDSQVWAACVKSQGRRWWSGGSDDLGGLCISSKPGATVDTLLILTDTHRSLNTWPNCISGLPRRWRHRRSPGNFEDATGVDWRSWQTLLWQWTSVRRYGSGTILLRPCSPTKPRQQSCCFSLWLILGSGRLEDWLMSQGSVHVALALCWLAGGHWPWRHKLISRDLTVLLLLHNTWCTTWTARTTAASHTCYTQHNFATLTNKTGLWTGASTTLGKLFTLMCLCRCMWSSGWCRLVTFRLRFDSHHRSFTSNLEQVVKLVNLCSGQLSLLSSAGWKMSSSLRAMGQRPHDWWGGMSASCKL